MTGPTPSAGATARAISGFEHRYNTLPSAVSRAPGRVNLMGEHLDYNGGKCLPIAIGQSAYAAITIRSDTTLRVVSEGMENPFSGQITELSPDKLPGWWAYTLGVLWALLEAGYDLPGCDIFLTSDVPRGAGVSSSAAVECAIAVAVLGELDIKLTDEVRGKLVEVCMRAETEVAGAPTGGLDQTACLFAQANSALLLDFQTHSREVVSWYPELDELVLLVINTKVSHSLAGGEYGIRRRQCEAAAQMLGLSNLAQATPDDLAKLPQRLAARARHVLSENRRTTEVVAAAQRGDWRTVGDCFVASHESLRDDYEVSCAELDTAVSTSMRHGAFGARMTGGGFGGSAIVLAKQTDQAEIRESVTAEFVRRSWAPPEFFVATPAEAANLVDPQ